MSNKAREDKTKLMLQKENNESKKNIKKTFYEQIFIIIEGLKIKS